MNGNKERYLVYSNAYRLNADGQEPDKGSIDNDTTFSDEINADDKKKSFIRSFFNDNLFRNIALLTGAGSSVLCGGKIRDGLWEACKKTIALIGGHFSEKFKEYSATKDIEAFLSYAIQYDAINKEDGLPETIKKLKAEIRKACTLQLSGCTHEEILKKMTARKASLPRTEIFTTNYDTLFEQAAKKSGIIVIDGFSFSQPRTFSGRFFDLDIVDRECARVKAEENYVPNVIHLHKLHGSLDWVMEDDFVVQRDPKEGEDPLIIYPSKEKYAESYDQPYFEMMARFQSLLRKKDCLLMVAGYGFADKHINSAIIEAVRQNPSFHLLIVDYGEEVEVENGQKNRVINLDFYRKVFTDIRSNVTIVQGTFDSFVNDMPLNKTYRVDNSREIVNRTGDER
ncbi:MAG: SIR2 family protein [Kiritimatiellae bacterium]|nr:SIR2 family protein [Kiritimatiellia bacterium]